MKLTFTIFLLTALQTWATVSYSQSTNLSINLKNATVQTVLQQIEDQSEFYFLYSSTVTDVNRTVSMQLKDAKIIDVLNMLFKESDVVYKVDGRQIVLSKKDADFENAVQQKSVSGKVTDSSGSSIPGVSVVVKGTTNGTITDANGNYSLSNVPENAIVQFSFVGMKGQEVAVAGKTTINVTLSEETVGVDEVVVVGYGTVRKNDMTGAVSSVKAKDLALINAVNVNNMLQGKVPGLNIVSSTSQPGGNMDINIRGALSPNGSNAPLYVIDGVPIINNSRTDNFGNGSSGLTGSINRNPLNTINPSDIESVDVLKDASATAIYGSAAANGVILITTKRGKEGKATVSYSVNYSIQTLKDYLKPLDATEFMTYHNLFMEENHKFVNKLAPYGTVDPSTLPSFSPFFTSDQIAKAGKGKNWMDHVMRPGSIKDHNISISGGTDQTKYFSSFNYFDQKGLLNNSNLSRYTGRMNLDQKIGSRINLKLGVTYSQVDNDNVPTGQAHNDEPSMLQAALRFAPNFDVYDANGNLSSSYLVRIPNPQSFLMVKNNSKTKRLLFTPSVDVNIMEGLKLSFVGGLDESSSKNNMYVPVGAKFQTAPNGNAQIAYNQVNNLSGESYLTFQRGFKNSNLTVVGGVGYYNTINVWDGLLAEGFLTDGFSSNNVGIASNKDKMTIWSGKNEQTKLSQFIRVNYSLIDKYILTFNGRRDGSSIWAEGKKWGIFPGIAAAWVISKESFISNISTINNLKMRVGYGTVGNEGLGGNYSMSLYGTGYNDWKYAFGNPGQVAVGILQSQLGNPELTWETDITINAGIDFSIFDNRVSGSADYFQRTAKDLFDWQTLPSANAIGRIGANIGSTRSTGFEFSLKTANIRSKDFSWFSDFTFSTNKTYWLERNPAISLAKYVGKNDPLRAIYGWKTDGIIRSKEEIPVEQPGSYVGNLKYVDISKDGKLDIEDVVYLGTPTPKAFFGFGNTVTYKGLDLNVFIYGNYGGLQWDQWMNFTGLTGAVGLAQPNPANAESSVKNVWASWNPNAKYPGLASNPINGNNPAGYNDFGLYKLYFARVRNITLGYNLPQGLIRNLNLFQSVRVFVDLQNYFVFSNNEGLDPEMERNNFPYPIARTTAFGLNVNFK